MKLKQAILALATAAALTSSVKAGVITVGTIIDGINSSGDNELQWVNDLLALNGVTGGTSQSTGNPDNQGPEDLTRFAGTDSAPAGVTGLGTDDDSAPFKITGAFTGIVLGKYGGGQGAGGSVVYFVTGETDWITPNDYGTFNSLSHTRAWATPTTGQIPGVPDGGSTITLMGVGLAGLGLIRRRS